MPAHIWQVVLELELDELIVQLSEESPEAREAEVALLLRAEESHEQATGHVMVAEGWMCRAGRDRSIITGPEMSGKCKQSCYFR